MPLLKFLATVRKTKFPTKICEASTKYLKAHHYHQATNQGDASSLCTPKLTLARIGLRCPN
jgi:hypothetical protein